MIKNQLNHEKKCKSAETKQNFDVLFAFVQKRPLCISRHQLGNERSLKEVCSEENGIISVIFSKFQIKYLINKCLLWLKPKVKQIYWLQLKCSSSTSGPFCRTLSRTVHDCQLLPHSGLLELFIQRTLGPTVPQFYFLTNWILLMQRYQACLKDGTYLEFSSAPLIDERCSPSCQSLVAWVDLQQ